MKEDCECKNWCRDGRDMYSDHHNRCQHYTSPPTDPRFSRFGEAVWKYIVKTGSDFFGCEISEDILPLAAKAGLCCRVPYEPELHGEGIDADPGDEIWWWGRQEERPDQGNHPSPGSVVFGPPPHTGAKKCCSCGGWIISDVSYWDGTAGPFCPTCWGVPSSYSSPNVERSAPPNE